MATLDLRYDGELKKQQQQQQQDQAVGTTTKATGRTLLYATIWAIIITGPLLGIMGLTFLATVTLLLVTAPLFIIFSPLLFCAGAGFLFVMTGLGVTAATALAGVSTLSLAFRSAAGTTSSGFLQQQPQPKVFDQFSPETTALRV